MSTVANNQFITGDEFKFAFRHHPAGVAVVTADAGNGPVSMTVSSLSSVSVSPPTLLFSASGISSATSTIRQAETLVVHLLTADQVQLALLGATSGADRFGEDVEWGRLPTGEPYYPNATEWLRGRVSKLIDVNGSTLVIVEVLQAKPQTNVPELEKQPLVYHNRTWYSLGPESKIS